MTLKARFLSAGVTLVIVVLASSLWSTAALFGVARSVDQSIRDNQTLMTLVAGLSDSLEREDDALLLHLSDSSDNAWNGLLVQRQQVDANLDALQNRWRSGMLASPAVRRTMPEAGDRLEHSIRDYRAAGDRMLALQQADADRDDHGLRYYHREVNPHLRHSISVCETLRQSLFQTMEEAAILARDQARLGTRRSILTVFFSLFFGAGVAIWLAQSVLRPVRQLTSVVGAIRSGDFGQRLTTIRHDELGTLGQTLNQMASSLEEYRQSSLGELLESKATLSAILRALPDPVLMFSPDGQLLEKNPPAELFLRPFVGGDQDPIHQSRVPQQFRQALHNALQGQPTLPKKVHFDQTLQVTADAGVRRWLISAIPVRQPVFDPSNDRGTFGAVVVLEDVTELANLDELRAELIGLASHELRSPLTSLRMNLAMLSETSQQFNQRQQCLLIAAEKACDELELTIEELLDVTRVEAGKLRLHPSDVHLQPVVTRVIDALRDRYLDAGVDLRMLAPQQPLVIQADGKRLVNVLTNLLNNALNYAPEQSQVWIKLMFDKAAGVDNVLISIADQGPGIPDLFRERVFEKFFRVEHQGLLDRDWKARQPRGTGIGLYLCREIVRAHGGQIWCEPNQPTGTVMFVRLPFANALTNPSPIDQ